MFSIIIQEIEREIGLFATCEFTYIIMLTSTFIVLFNCVWHRSWKRY